MSQRSIGVICDSTADFPAGVAEALGLHILPVHIVVEDRNYLHGVGIGNTEVIQNLKQNKTVFTTPFYPHECADLFEKLLRQYDRVVSLHLSTHLSGCYKSALTALRLLPPALEERVTVVDLKNVSVSLGLAVQAAVLLLRAGCSPETLADRMAPFIQYDFLAFTVHKLKWLRKGGRVSALAAFVGGMLDVKPIIQLKDARLIPIERQRGKKAARRRLLEMAVKHHQLLKGRADIWVAYADNLQEALRFREQLATMVAQPANRIQMVEIGATISVHTGPGAVGVAAAPRLRRRRQG
jgi:DegV family protein with EDD domain